MSNINILYLQLIPHLLIFFLSQVHFYCKDLRTRSKLILFFLLVFLFKFSVFLQQGCLSWIYYDITHNSCMLPVVLFLCF